MERERNFCKSFKPSPYKKRKTANRLEIKNIAHKPNICYKKYNKDCLMGNDCPCVRCDDDINEIKEKSEYLRSLIDNSVKNELNKKIKLEIDTFDNSNDSFINQNMNHKRDFKEKHPRNKQKNKSKQGKYRQIDDALSYNMNNFAIGCNIYSNLVGNYSLKKNITTVSIIPEILNNLDKITNNAIILKCMFILFPIFRKLYNDDTKNEILLASNNPIYKIQQDDSIETKEEKLKITSLDKLHYTNMVIAHQSSMISKIYKYNNSENFNMLTSLLNNISKNFIVDLYLKSYYSHYREPVTDEECETLLNTQNFNIEEIGQTEEMKKMEEIDQMEKITPENEQNFGKQEFIKQELIESDDAVVLRENADSMQLNNLDEVKQFLRYFQN